MLVAMRYEFDDVRIKPTGDVSTATLMFVVIAAAQIVWLGPLVWLLLRSL